VALSRCRTIEGLSLSRPIRESDVHIDYESKQFYENMREMIKNQST